MKHENLYHDFESQYILQYSYCPPILKEVFSSTDVRRARL